MKSIKSTTTRRFLKKGTYKAIKDGQQREPRTFQIEKGVLDGETFEFVCSTSKCQTTTFGVTELVKIA
jgi:hypothetical protein